MQKALGNEELALILRRKKHFDMLSEARRSLSDIYNDVLDLTARTADKFGLGIGRKLAMQPAHNAFLSTVAVIILNENRNGNARRLELFLVVRFHEPTAVIAEYLRFKNICTFQLCLKNVHTVYSSPYLSELYKLSKEFFTFVKKTILF